ncbi:MAG: FkbM family methyltransferase [Gammaproteobacteria bacterium]|nr:MAG: FkbM family methyltransferase [Gammaproteobacteria bacterium]
MDAISLFAQVLRDARRHLKFNIFEIGARAIHASEEPFYRLPTLFPGSRITAFEPDEALCAKQNDSPRDGVTYFPLALGRTEETRAFYNTEGAMCSSLYKPNEELLGRYNNMDVARVKNVSSVDTFSLDHFVSRQNLGPVDFIKIDIQGAELDVFQGGVSTLKNVLAIVTEAEFIEHYVDQPLFGDVCSFLSKHQLQFQKIIGVGGRTLKPILLNDDPNLCSQQMWADVLFIRFLFDKQKRTGAQYLKIAALALLYDCLDVALFCCREFDMSEQSTVGQRFVQRLNS